MQVKLHATDNRVWIFITFATSIRLVQMGFTQAPYVHFTCYHFKIYFCHSVVAFTTVLSTEELDLGTVILRMALNVHRSI